MDWTMRGNPFIKEVFLVLFEIIVLGIGSIMVWSFVLHLLTPRPRMEALLTSQIQCVSFLLTLKRMFKELIGEEFERFGSLKRRKIPDITYY
jgi:uncharacterized membrane protein